MPDMTTDNQAVKALMRLAGELGDARIMAARGRATQQSVIDASDELRAAFAAALAAERQAERDRWEAAIGAVMPADFKDWHQNAQNERPQVAAAVIQSLRERESLAWDQVEAERERALEDAAQLCESMGRGQGFAFAEFDCAEEIRALKAKEEGK